MGLFSKPRDPNAEANNYLNKIPGETQPYYQPYMDAGKASLDKLTKQYDDMMNDPGGHFNKLGAGYTQSPGYQNNLRTALAGANNAAAMGGGGGLGSYGHQQLASNAAENASNRDYEQYINHILGIESAGTAGEQGIENQGYDANTSYAQMLAQLRNAQGNNAANAAGAANQHQANNWSSIISGLGTIGAGIAGGPVGAAAGKAAANYFFPSQGG